MKRFATQAFVASPPVRLFVACLLMLAGARTVSAAEYNLVHGFAGPPNDGDNPTYNSLSTDGNVLYGFTGGGGTNRDGTLFKVDADGTGYQVLYSFTGGTNGFIPVGTPLLLGGEIYGMTYNGGRWTNGTIFKINTNGTGFQLLHSFGNILAGQFDEHPQGSLVSDGVNLYGMTPFSLFNQGEGEIFAIGTNGAGFTIYHNFSSGLSDGSNPNGSLLLSDGVLYGTTSSGGTNGGGTVFRLNSDGSGFQLLYCFTSFFGGTNQGANPWGSLILSGSTLYGTTLGGGSGYGTVFSVQTDGSGIQVLHNFSNLELWAPRADLTLSNSTLYGIADNFSNNNLPSGGVFQLNADGTGYQILHVFAFTKTNNVTDGYAPFENSLLSLGGQLYGMTQLGGSTNNAGTLFSLDLGADVGGLTVNILPPEAVSAGAQWQADGGPLQNSGMLVTNLSPGSHTISFAPAAGWQPAPQQIAVVSLGTTNTITATYTDPAAAISTPNSGQFISNSLFEATGTASDDVAIAGVYYQLNGGAWSTASTSDDWTNWSAGNLPFTAGTNVFSVYAMDASLNLSATDSVSFVYFPSAELTININGPGTVTPDLNGDFVGLGKIVSLSAKAEKGCKFVNWTGSTNTTRSKITFPVAPGLVFNANFQDTTRPVDVILSPTKNQVVTNPAPVATGKASDNVGVAAVWFQVDGGDWMTANIPNGTNWTTPGLLPFLLAGPNTIKAFAQDAAGNSSLTNSVPFKYLVQPGADWAPDSLNGLLATVTPGDSVSDSLGFDLSTFAECGFAGDSYAGDFGGGNYSYVKTGTNTAQLSVTFTNPPGNSNSFGPVTVVFTNHYFGNFTNAAEETVVFAASIATNFIPATVVGKSIIATNANTGKTSTFKISTSTFVKTPAVNSSTGTSSGTYSFARYSPVTGLFTFAFTDTADAGNTGYLQTTYTTATSGNYFLSVFDSTSTLQYTESGQFKLK